VVHAKGIKLSRWTEQDYSWLKENYNMPYSDLEKYLGKSVRAIKNKVKNLKLHRDERRQWSKKEFDILKQYPQYSPRDFIENKLLNRSSYQIADKLRGVRGTARKHLKEKWDEPSVDLAYILGAIASDGLVDKRGIEVSQKKTDSIFLDNLERLILKVFGFKCKRNIYWRTWEWKGKSKKDQYSYLGVFSNKILGDLGGLEAEKRGNLKDNGDWSILVERFPWLFKKEYSASFLAGLFDGDGSGSDRNISIAVLPEKSAKVILKMLKQHGIEANRQKTGVRMGLSSSRKFLDLVGPYFVLRRKADKFILGKKMNDGVNPLTKIEVGIFLQNHHYLGNSIPAGNIYGFVESGALVAVAILGSHFGAGTLKNFKVRELKRFAAFGGKYQSSKYLAAIVNKFCKDNPNIEVLVSYADSSYGHEGTLYKASNWDLVGKSGSTIRIISDSGKVFGGRYLSEQLISSGVDVSKCHVEVISGKNKYIYVIDRSRRAEIVNLFNL
jgi:hypothetical protein